MHCVSSYINYLSLLQLNLVVVEELVCPDNPKSYASGSLATGKVSHVEQVKG